MSSPTVMTHQYDDNEASQELFQEFFTRTPNKGFAMGGLWRCRQCKRYKSPFDILFCHVIAF